MKASLIYFITLLHMVYAICNALNFTQWHVEQEPGSTGNAPREDLEHHQWQNSNGSSFDNGMVLWYVKHPG